MDTLLRKTPESPQSFVSRPELLAPAGDWDSLRAAVAGGADAVYFGVETFNARARAQNFRADELPDVMAFLHLYGVKGYMAFNILVFEDELDEAKRLIRAAVEAGVDALIVQDLGVIRLLRELSPDMPIHASTQTTATSPEAVEFLRSLGVERVVLGRENSLKHIRMIAERTRMPLEVFVHGALCVSYSGQCLTSEMWGGRSANRGECAQACRLPYELVVDGKVKPMGDVRYLLSPMDLAAIELVPRLIEAGVASFKIEGRLKSAEYVANTTAKYRKAIDDATAGRPVRLSAEEMRELQQSFSRGFTTGFLEGTNHKRVVEGTFPKSRGVYLGRVRAVLSDAVVVDLEAPLKRGDGIVFDAGDPESDEEGGRVYDLRRNGRKWEGEAPGGRFEVVMGRGDVDLKRIRPGHRVWKTDDPALNRKLRATFETDRPYRTFPVRVRASGREGRPLVAEWTDASTGRTVVVESSSPLQPARTRPLDRELLAAQFGRLGGTPFVLEAVESDVPDGLAVAVRELNDMRRRAVSLLEAERRKPPQYRWCDADPYADAFGRADDEVETAAKSQAGIWPPAPADESDEAEKTDGSPAARLVALCRTLEQVRAACGTDVAWIYADPEFFAQMPEAIAIAREAGKPIALAVPRVHMPGENGYFRRILDLRPDAVLVRNLGALEYFRRIRDERPDEPAPMLIGDFSLNAANHKTVRLLFESGCVRVTASYDLNARQMAELVRRSDPRRLEIVIHQHLPMFHTEHCVYCAFLSEGTDYTNCGRPCERHRVSLRDRLGMDHPVRVDEGCRNTVYNAIEQSGAEFLPTFLKLGARFFRIEFLEEPADRVVETIELYRRAIAGEIEAEDVWKTLKALRRLGVTRGHLAS